MSTIARLALLVALCLGCLAAPAATAQVVQQGPSSPRLGPAPIADAETLALEGRGITPRGIGLLVDTSNRQQVVDLYNGVFAPALTVPGNWNGSTSPCNAGTVSSAYRAASVQVLNYFRAMTGLPADIAELTGASDLSAQAALMMKANGALDHTPPANWDCYTSGGAQAAGSSNLAFGAAGPYATWLYIADPGDGNYFVGHRRWLLYPPLVAIGRGDTDNTNAMWVLPRRSIRPGGLVRRHRSGWPGRRPAMFRIRSSTRAGRSRGIRAPTSPRHR